MCGIIGINTKDSNIIDSVVKGLKNLEYRGYDSAGISAIVNGAINTVKTKGKIEVLEAEVTKQNVQANLAIGHTRWATHGAATTINAHPHQTTQVSVVHNGIIENYLGIKKELIQAGYVFQSETDSEIIPHLITLNLNNGQSPLEAVNNAIKRLEGAFSIVALFSQFPEIMISARKGSPLVIGYEENKMIISSDAYAIGFLTNRVTYLEEGDVAVLYSDKVEIYNQEQQVNRDIIKVDNNQKNSDKGSFPHYMLKEIYEQSSIVANIIDKYSQNFFSELDIDFNKISKITLIACGSSYYSSMTAKYWLERKISLPIEIDIASEFRYRSSYLPENGLCIFLSQSGETADTLAALRYAKQKKQITLSIVNVKASSLAREADYSLECFAGKEISVASTKGFTSQLVVLLLLSLHIASQRGRITKEELEQELEVVSQLPGRISECLNINESIRSIAKDISNARNAIFIARNHMYPIALEGALKLKELSYIHAEAIAAGELKHGPIALVDENVPVIVLAPENNLFDKTISNAQEVAARGGNLITISSSEGNAVLKSVAKHQLNISSCNPLIEPVVYTIAMQLLAYYFAVEKGTDVDQPRNLAKSVTVE
jgi:glutamine---fructose-6-phosphate transaminase (isomerizing)